MQQSSLSTRTVINNDGTVASRMLHSLIQDYNNNSSVPPSPRESTEYFRSSLIIKPQQTQHQAEFSIREENQDVNIESYQSNLSMGSQSHLVELMVKKESQLKELQNFIMKEIEEINENKERQSRLKQRILNVRESMCEIKQSHCESGMLVRGQLQEMKEQLVNRFEEMVVYLLTQHKQATQTYITEINRLKDQLTEKQIIISQKSTLLNQNQSIIDSLQQQIALLKHKQLEYAKNQKQKDLQLQKLRQDLQALKQKQFQKQMQTHQNIELQISQVRQRQKEQERYRQKQRKSLGIHIAEDDDQEFSIKSHYNQDQHKPSSQRQKLSLRTQQLNPHSQHHLEVSFSADNRDQQAITNILVNQPTLNSNSKECLINLVQSCSQDEKLLRQNTNSDKQLTGGFGDGSDYMRVRFQVETSSIQQKSERQEEYEFDNGNNYHEEKTKQQYSKNVQRLSGQNQKYYQKTLNHSQSQKSPKQQSFIQSSEVHRMNTMSFSLNQANDITAINQLDVFSDNGFAESNKNKQDPMSDYEQDHQQNQKERKSIVRSHGGAYSFKKGHAQLLVSQNHQENSDKVEISKQTAKQTTDNNEGKPIMTKAKGDNKIATKQEKQSSKTIQKNETPPNKTKESYEINPQSNGPMVVGSGTTGKTKNQPQVPKITSTSVINLQPVQQQSSAASTKRKRSPHRFDYCRLYQEQQIKEIQNINQVCNNILLNSGGSTKRQNNDIQNPRQITKITPFPLKDYTNRSIGNEDIIKQRISSLKKDLYPSFRNTPKEPTNISTAFTNISSIRTPLSPSSHSKKGLTIQIPQSPNINNPYYKVENYIHQISVKEFSPQKSQKYTDRNNLTSYSIHSKTKQTIQNSKSKQIIQNKQLSYYNRVRDREIEAEQNVSIYTNRSQLLASKHKQRLPSQQNNNLRENHIVNDRKQYIKSKIQHIKRKNLNQTNHPSQTNTVYIDTIGINNTNIHQDTTLNRNSLNLTKNHYNVSESTGGRSPRLISFLKSQQQQNTPSRLELQRPPVVNRSVMMNNNTNRTPAKPQLRQRSQQSYTNIKGYQNTNNRVYDNTNNKVYDNINNKVYDNTGTKGYQQVKGVDFNEDKLQKQLRQQIRSNKQLLNRQKPPIQSPEFRKTNTKGSKLSQNQSFSYSNKKTLGESNHNVDRKSMRDVTEQIGNSNNYKGNDIYEQLNNHKNANIVRNQQREQQPKSALKQIVRQSDKKSPLKRNTQNLYLPSSNGMNSSTMSPLKLSSRNNNSLYLQGSQVKSSSKNLTNNNSSLNYYEEKYSQQNGHRNTPYVNNDRKTPNKTLINNANHWKDNDQDVNLRWYDPAKGVAGFRRF